MYGMQQLSLPWAAVFAILLHLKLQESIEASWVGVLMPLMLGQLFTSIPSVLVLLRNEQATVVQVYRLYTQMYTCIHIPLCGYYVYIHTQSCILCLYILYTHNDGKVVGRRVERQKESRCMCKHACESSYAPHLI
jgi:hypothetical protein